MHRRLLAVAIGLGAVAPADLRAQVTERLVLGQGTVLVIADDTTGLDLWAARGPTPRERRSPDFVGWFDPDRVLEWLLEAHALLSAPPPDSAGIETPALEAIDGGFVTVVRVSPAIDTAHPIFLAFGHRRERLRWSIPVAPAEAGRLLATLERVAPLGRLQPPADLGYANPTNRDATPDRDPSATPRPFPGVSRLGASAVRCGRCSILDRRARYGPGP